VSSSRQMRWTGLAAILAGTMFIVSDLLDLATDSDGFGPKNLSEEASTAVSAVQSGLTLLAGLVLLVGLAGLYSRQLEDGGLLGMVGFLVAFYGTVMAVGVFWADAFVAPSLAREELRLLSAAPPKALAAGLTLSYGSVALGWLLFGWSALRTGLYPRQASVLLMIGAALTWLPLPLSGVPFSIAVVWMGYALFWEKEAPEE
jgi:hypothetical protein